MLPGSTQRDGKQQSWERCESPAAQSTGSRQGTIRVPKPFPNASWKTPAKLPTDRAPGEWQQWPQRQHKRRKGGNSAQLCPNSAWNDNATKPSPTPTAHHGACRVHSLLLKDELKQQQKQDFSTAQYLSKLWAEAPAQKIPSGPSSAKEHKTFSPGHCTLLTTEPARPRASFGHLPCQGTHNNYSHP